MAAPEWESSRAELRFGLRACLVGWLVVYALALPARAAGLLPAHITWPGLIVVPSAFFALYASVFAGPLLLGRRWAWFFAPVALACILAMLAVIWVERGW